MNHDAVTTGTLLLIAAFAIDRTASGITFLFSRPRERSEAAQQQATSAWNQRMLYFVVASILAIILLGMSSKIRVLASLGLIPEQTAAGIMRPGAGATALETLADLIITFIVLVGGADRLSGILSKTGGGESKIEPEPPLEVRGTLTLYDAEGAPRKLPNVKEMSVGK